MNTAKNNRNYTDKIGMKQSRKLILIDNTHTTITINQYSASD